jgi:predicted transcriptional regulator
MNQTGNRRLLVAGKGVVLGIITLTDMLKSQALKVHFRRK